jgi:hypothetical protein
MDDEQFHLGEKDYPTLVEATEVADAFVAEDPNVSTADVYNDEGHKVYSAGTL